MSSKIRWGILSTAQIAENQMIPAIRATGRGEVVAAASRTEEKARAFADRLDIPKAYGSYQKLLDDPEIDAVYNPLPVSMHAEWSIRAAEAGKPVLCEKPLTETAAEAEQLIRAFSEHNLLLSEALMYRYHPLSRRVKDLVDQGAVGKLTMMHSQFNINAPEGDIRLRKETGGGGLLDLGSYCLAYMRYLAGEEPSDIKAAARFNQDGVDVNLTAALLFPSGVTGHFGCSLEADFDCFYGACGTEGRLLVDTGALCAWPGQAFVIKLWNGDGFQEIETPAANPYQLLVEDFQAALRNEKAMDISIEGALNNMRAIDAVRASAGAVKK